MLLCRGGVRGARFLPGREQPVLEIFARPDHDQGHQGRRQGEEGRGGVVKGELAGRLAWSPPCNLHYTIRNGLQARQPLPHAIFSNIFFRKVTFFVYLSIVFRKNARGSSFAKNSVPHPMPEHQVPEAARACLRTVPHRLTHIRHVPQKTYHARPTPRKPCTASFLLKKT